MKCRDRCLPTRLERVAPASSSHVPHPRVPETQTLTILFDAPEFGLSFAHSASMKIAPLGGVVVVLVMAALGGCSGSAPETDGRQGTGGSGGAGGSGGNGDAAQQWETMSSIFDANCSRCHGAAWSSCWTVHSCESDIYGAVSSGFMPLTGTLPASEKSELLHWLAEGAHCAGPEPQDEPSTCEVSFPPYEPLIPPSK
jgi:hypothetical protein